MRFIFSFFLLCPLLAFSGQSDLTISAKRNPNETFEHALNRVKDNFIRNEIKPLIIRDTPIGNKVPIHQIDFTTVPDVATYEELMHLFKIIRDTRFLNSEAKPEFKRRISWLYPDDGCFARAALSIIELEHEHLIKPAKIFAFGDLMVETPYSSDGYVSWWYHVSTVVRYMGSIYILDPAMNAEKPLLVDDWFNNMASEEALQGVVCNSYTYGPFDNCFKNNKDSDNVALKDEFTYLNLEWNRISLLGFDPMSILGDNPPWDVYIAE